MTSVGVGAYVRDERIREALRVGRDDGPRDEAGDAFGHAFHAIVGVIYERLDTLQPEAYWEDEYRQRYITDRAWASTAEAAHRCAASIILAGRLSPDIVVDLAAPWRQIDGAAETAR